MSHESDLMREGKLIQRKSFSKEKKNIIIDGNIAIDFKKGRGNFTVFEIKKSRKMSKASRYQLYFYLWYLKKKGINAMGILTYPEERRREHIVLTPDIERELERIIVDILEISKMESPPKPRRKRYCKKCSYHDLCWV